MQPAKTLAPRTLPTTASKLCLEGRRDAPLPSNDAPQLGFEETQLAVVEEKKGLMVPRFVIDWVSEVSVVVFPCGVLSISTFE